MLILAATTTTWQLHQEGGYISAAWPRVGTEPFTLAYPTLFLINSTTPTPPESTPWNKKLGLWALCINFCICCVKREEG